MVYKRVNLQMRSEYIVCHTMHFKPYVRIARFKYVYVPEQWIKILKQIYLMMKVVHVQKIQKL